MELSSQIIQPFSLILGRLTPLFLASTVSPMGHFPAMVRLVLLMTLSVSLTLLHFNAAAPLSNGEWLFAMASELMLGALLLLGLQLVYAAWQIMGRVLDMQIGFAAAGVVDPVTNNNDPLLGYLFTLLLSLAVFVTNTHHDLLQALHTGFVVLPPGTWHGQLQMPQVMAYLASHMVIAFLLFGPVLLGLWLLDIFNGVIAKTMPQMNVYFVMLPLKIGLGLYLLSLAATQFKPLLQQTFALILQWFSGAWGM